VPGRSNKGSRLPKSGGRLASQKLSGRVQIDHDVDNERRVIDKPVIHRDLKSPNLLLQILPPPFGQEDRDIDSLVCKISDFGLSRDKSLDTVRASLLIGGGYWVI
jgi:serine/threonine protein kinase